MAGRRALRIGAEGGAEGRGRGLHRLGSRAGSRAGWPPSGQLLLRKDPGVAGSAPEDLGADPVLLATAGAFPTAPVRALVDAAEVPAAHVAGRTLAEGMDTGRDDVADRNCGNNQNRYHARYSLLTPPEPPVALVPPFTRAGYRDPERVGHRRSYWGWISPPVFAHLHRVNHSGRICEVILTRRLPQ